MERSFRRFAVTAARAAADKKAKDIKVLDVQRVSSITDFMLLSTVESPFQMKAVAETIEEALENKGLEPLRSDGAASTQWKVLDYGGILIHIMQPESREFYGLDRLYMDAKKIRWQAPPSKKKKKKPSR